MNFVTLHKNGEVNIVFFEKYCALCKERGLSPTAATVSIGVSRGSVTAWRKGERLPSASVLQKIADFFDVTVDYLLSDGAQSTTAEDDESLNEYLNELKNREDMRILFSLASGATKEEVMQAVKIIEALRHD